MSLSSRCFQFVFFAWVSFRAYVLLSDPEGPYWELLGSQGMFVFDSVPKKKQKTASLEKRAFVEVQLCHVVLFPFIYLSSLQSSPLRELDGGSLIL